MSAEFNLYVINNSNDDIEWVLAVNMEEALAKWRDFIKSRDDINEFNEDPDSICFLNDYIL